MDVRMPDGTIVKGVPEGTTKDQLAAKLAGRYGFPEIAPQQVAESRGASFADKLLGGAETAASVVSGALAEPVAGIAGVAQALNPFASEGAGARAVEGVRDALRYQPQTQTGQQYAQNTGGFVAPVANAISGAENWLGDTAYDMTGSPAVAAAAKAAPTAMMELLGIGAAKYATRAGKTAKEMDAFMAQAAPDAARLKDVSRQIYREIDDMGVKVKADAFSSLASKISRETRKSGMDADITPAANKAVNRFNELIGQEVPLSEIETLREVAQGAASSLNRREQMLGKMIIDNVDEFLDTAGATALSRAKDGAEIGKRYRVARELWGRARKSELLDDAIKAADLQASGFENGLRIQFRQILKNRKQGRFFTAAERAEMEKVVKGTLPANAAKLLGRLGFSEGKATNLIGGTIGAGTGAALGSAGGPLGSAIGAAAVTGAGQLSRKLAQRLTLNNAKFADQLVRAGKNGREITKAYFANTPKAERSARELSELLANPDIALDLVEGGDLVKRAVELANNKRALSAAAGAGAAKEGALLTEREFVR